MANFYAFTQCCLVKWKIRQEIILHISILQLEIAGTRYFLIQNWIAISLLSASTLSQMDTNKGRQKHRAQRWQLKLPLGKCKQNDWNIDYNIPENYKDLAIKTKYMWWHLAKDYILSWRIEIFFPFSWGNVPQIKAS